MRRRDVLQVLALGAGAAGCGTLPQPLPPPRPPEQSLIKRTRLPPVRVSPGREIRTVVGLRPFRPSGFVVRADKLGDKVVVHNYGHGGGGVTLSWGTADLAARAAMGTGARRMAVLGCGAVGMATARILQQRGVDVTIYAEAMPPDTTSSIAGAQCFPFTVFDRNAITPAFRDQFVLATEIAYKTWQSMVGETYGVRWMANYLCTDKPPGPDGLTGTNSPIRHLLPELVDLHHADHPFPHRHVRRFMTMMIEPAVYLPAILRDVRLAGARIVVRRFATSADVASLPEPVVVNCTGLGARALFGDDELVANKGQLTVLLPQPEVDYAVLAGDLYMFSRRDGVLLGGTHERGVDTLEPNLGEKGRILDGHARLFEEVARVGA